MNDSAQKARIGDHLSTDEFNMGYCPTCEHICRWLANGRSQSQDFIWAPACPRCRTALQKSDHAKAGLPILDLFYVRPSPRPAPAPTEKPA